MKIILCCTSRESLSTYTGSVDIDCCHLPTKKTVSQLADILTEIGHTVYLVDGTPENICKEISNRTVDLAFPIYSSSGGNGKQMWLPVTLELLGVPFVGSSARSVLLSSDKYQSGLLAKEYGVPAIPSAFLIAGNGEKKQYNDEFGYPCIVKPNFESNSKGVYLAYNPDELWNLAEMDWNTYKQEILCQPLLRGTEVTVSLYEINGKPHVFGMAESLDANGTPPIISSYETKHIQKSFKRKPNLSETCYDTICDYAITLFSAFDFHDYARIDFRLDDNSIPHLLEVTPTPTMPFSASFFAGGALYGIPPAIALTNIIDASARRNLGTNSR